METQRILQAFNSFPWAADLDAVQRQALAGFSQLRVLRAGETIFCQGEPSPYCFGVLEGQVRLSRVVPAGGGIDKELMCLGPGEMFGETALFVSGSRMAMASAHTNGELLAIRGRAFRAWIEAQPQAALPLLFGLLEATHLRLRHSSRELTALYGISRLMGETPNFEEAVPSILEWLSHSLSGGVDAMLFVRDPAMPVYRPWPNRNKLWTVPLSFEPLTEAEARRVAVPMDANGRTVWNRLAGEEGTNVNAMAVVPLFDGDPHIHFLKGFLWVASSNPEAFDQGSLQLLTSVSYSISAALGHACAPAISLSKAP